MTANRITVTEPSVILVVDDEMSLRLSMRAALEKVGFTVSEAANGVDALTVFNEKRPDLVLLDVMMPEMDGYETCSAIRHIPGGEDIPIVMVTGLDDEDSASQAFEAGATDFITKPLNWVMLGQRIRYVLKASIAFKDLKKSKERLAQAQQIAKLGHWELNLADGSFQFSEEACHILDLDQSDADMTQKVFFQSVHPKDLENVLCVVKNALQEKQPYTLQYRIVLPDNSERFIFNQGEIIADDNGAPQLMMGTVQDITKQKEVENEARYLTFYDQLTGLANNMLFTDRIEQSMIKAQRNEELLALIFLDLDRFKRINDTLGHQIGDLLLKEVAERLSNCIRKSDAISRIEEEGADYCISRLGGDEFTILLTDIKKPDDAANVARRILESIEPPFIFGGNEVYTTASVGISIFPIDGEDTYTLMKNADTAMYHAKEKGRNNYQFYQQSLNASAMGKFELENDLRRAMEKNEFELHYQPQVDINSLKIVGVEALIRWQHPKLGLVPPMKFIPMAEESGLIVPISDWVLNTACKQNKAWQNMGLQNILMAVNLSSQQFDSQDIDKLILDALKESGLEPHFLEVEMTEGVIMQKGETTKAILNEIKKLGVKIAIDDFGTGYSSLSYLPAFPIDTLKIDRSFVVEITDSSSNVAIIKAIIAMGHSMGHKIIAEGVETIEHLTLLKEFGCDEVQGYFFSKPVPAEELAALLKQKTFTLPA
jgi:diguanylate cyclase (GGDEF)-like protein/PAS domain S-box-containing protein